jgi:hypothetical protein
MDRVSASSWALQKLQGMVLASAKANDGVVGSYKNNVINANGIDGTPLTSVVLN